MFPSPLVGKVSESCRLEDRLDNSLSQTQQPPVEELESIAQHSVRGGEGMGMWLAIAVASTSFPPTEQQVPQQDGDDDAAAE